MLPCISEMRCFCFAGLLPFICRWEEVREESECDREKEFGEGNDYKDGERYEAAKILDSSLKLH